MSVNITLFADRLEQQGIFNVESKAHRQTIYYCENGEIHIENSKGKIKFKLEDLRVVADELPDICEMFSAIEREKRFIPQKQMTDRVKQLNSLGLCITEIADRLHMEAYKVRRILENEKLGEIRKRN